MKISNAIKGCIALLLMVAPAQAGGEAWTSDFAAAKKLAKEQNKDLLLEFTGSDWCPPCKMLTSKILSKAEFSEPASKKFVLVVLDYPRGIKQDEALIAQNRKLSSLYAVRGFPTILLCDADGMPYAQSGFSDMEPAAYAEMLVGLQAGKVSRDEAIKKAMALDGVERAKALEAVLKELETKNKLSITAAFSPILTAITEADPADSSGFASKLLLLGKLGSLGTQDDEKPAFAELDAYLKKYNVEGLDKQQLLVKKIDVYFARKNWDGMRKTIDEIIAVDPKSELAISLEKAKPRIDSLEKQAKGAEAK